MFIINKEDMYIHIPKTSGTNLRYVFLNSENNVVNYDEVHQDKILSVSAKNIFWRGRNIQDILEHPLCLNELDYLVTKHSPLWVWQQSGDWKNHKVITTVRNPYTRAVSLYKQILRMFGDILDQQITFFDFLHNQYIQSVVDRFPQNHKTQQVEHLKDLNGEIKVDRFYKMETDLDMIAQQYNLVNIHTQKHNTGNYDKDYSRIYNDFLIDWVRTTYVDDFKFFSYDTQPFWL